MISKKLTLLGLILLMSITGFGQVNLIAYTSPHFDKQNDNKFKYSNHRIMDKVVKQRITKKIEELSGSLQIPHNKLFISTTDFERISQNDAIRNAFANFQDGAEIKYVISFEYIESPNKLSGEVVISIMDLDGNSVDGKAPWTRNFDIRHDFKNATEWMQQVTLEMEKVVKEETCRDYVIIATFDCQNCTPTSNLALELERALRKENKVNGKFFIDLNRSMAKTDLIDFGLDGIHGIQSKESDNEKVVIDIFFPSRARPTKRMELPNSLPKIKERLVSYLSDITITQ